MKTVMIDPLSASSLLLQVCTDNQVLGTATGFPIKISETFYLVTNWHVVTGRSPYDNKLNTPTEPNNLKILHHHNSGLGKWCLVQETLFDNQKSRRWLEHSKGNGVDVILLPLTQLQNGVQIYPFDLDLEKANMATAPAMPVSIIGYPFGLKTGGAFPIWKTGHIASDPDLDFDGKPAFLIDATTRGGMSGSPVVLRMTGGYQDNDGNMIMTTGTTTKFLGVYSGRIHKDSEIGIVWRPQTIADIHAASLQQRI